MRQSVPVRPALLSLATGAAFVLATPAVASQGQHTQIPPASAQRQPAPVARESRAGRTGTL